MSFPDDFLTRYSTTVNSCSCPFRKWFPTIECKHMKVASDNDNWREWMRPKRESQPFNGPFTSQSAKLFADEHGYSQADIFSYISEVLTFPVLYLTKRDVLSYHYFITNIYKTTITSCQCKAREFNNNVPCKHMSRLLRLRVENQNGNTHYTTTNEVLVNNVEEFNKIRNDFEAEKNEIMEKMGLCPICYSSTTIKSCDTCSHKICIECYYSIEKSKSVQRPCPFCRKKMRPLIDVLMEKFKNINM